MESDENNSQMKKRHRLKPLNRLKPLDLILSMHCLVHQEFGELRKHAKVHDGIEYECNVCNYTNPDIRNVKAHEWSHRMGTAGHRYFCDICGQGFTWYTSWQRHKFSKKKCVARSNSPQY